MVEVQAVKALEADPHVTGVASYGQNEYCLGGVNFRLDGISMGTYASVGDKLGNLQGEYIGNLHMDLKNLILMGYAGEPKDLSAFTAFITEAANKLSATPYVDAGSVEFAIDSYGKLAKWRDKHGIERSHVLLSADSVPRRLFEQHRTDAGARRRSVS